jgi:hypothetical protein
VPFLRNSQQLTICTALQRKQARFAIKVAYLNCAHQELLKPTTVLGFNSSDAVLIKVACGQVGSVGIKLCNRLPSESSHLLETEQLCNEIFGRIDDLMSRINERSVSYRSVHVDV